MDKIKTLFSGLTRRRISEPLEHTEQFLPESTGFGPYEGIAIWASRKFLTYYSAICHIPISQLDFCEAKTTGYKESLIREDPIKLFLGRKSQHTHARCKKRTIVANTFVLLYIVTTLKMFLIMCFQYIYDVNSLRLDILHESVCVSNDSCQSPSSASWSQELDLSYSDEFLSKADLINFDAKLKSNMESVFVKLKWLGCPYVHERFFSISGYIMVAGLNFLTYTMPMLIFRRWTNFEYIFFVGKCLEVLDFQVQ